MILEKSWGWGELYFKLNGGSGAVRDAQRLIRWQVGGQLQTSHSSESDSTSGILKQGRLWDLISNLVSVIRASSFCQFGSLLLDFWLWQVQKNLYHVTLQS